jgi:nucleotide-binding universal stress UspA family protein
MPPPDFRRITVAVDGSSHADAALDVAIDLARRYGSELSIVGVAPIQPPLVGPSEPMIVPAVPPSEAPRFQKIVEDAVGRAEASGLTAVTGVCDEGVVTDEILAHLTDHPCDLLVIGSRGLSAAKRLLLGSVSTAMVTHAPCPVLVVRPRVTTPGG